MDVATSTSVIEDGRTARRIRNRDAVIDALFDLLTEDGRVPDIEAIAARAGVSVSSTFRYFDGLDDLENQTIERYFTRYASLFEIPEIGRGDRADRIGRYVDARLKLWDAIAPIGRLARAKAYDKPATALALARARALFRDRIETHFCAELDGCSTGRKVETTAAVDACTSFETWDLQRTVYRLDEARVRSMWIAGLDRIFMD